MATPVPTQKVTSKPPVPAGPLLQEKRIEKMRLYFENRPKENIRIRKELGEQWVQINGYAFQIQAGVKVKVPVDVADLLREADII